MKKIISLTFLMSVLVACGTLDGTKVRQELGLVGQAPDEFLITTRRPLDIPQGQQLSLPKPTPGASSRVEIDPQQNALSALFGESALVQGSDFKNISDAESDLLTRAQGDAQQTDDIRATLDNEAGNTRRDGYFMYQLFPSLKAPGDREDDTIDARAEAERLRNKGVTDVPNPPVQD